MQHARKGDLVKNGFDTLGIVVSEKPCGDPKCTGQIQVRLVETKPGSQPMCYLRRDIEVVAPAANLIAELLVEATDDWGRPRCQQIDTYVDVDETYQCALVAGHDGDCDPLPVWPNVESA